MMRIMVVLAALALAACGSVEVASVDGGTSSDGSAEIADSDVSDGADASDENSARCESSAECEDKSPDTPICTGDGRCVECETSDQCQVDAPVCDAEAGVCGPCTEHSQCASEVCVIEEGTCAGEADVIYVAQDGSDGVDCGAADNPCATVSGDAGATAKLGENHRFIRLRAGNYTEAVSLFGVTATLVGPGATVSPPAASGDSAIDVAGGSDVVIDGLTLANASGSDTAHGLECVSATILVTRATLENNEAHGFFNRCPAIVRDTTVRANGEDGILVSGNDGALELIGSELTENGDVGLNRASTSDSVIVKDTLFTNNTGRGVTAGGSATITITRSLITGNADGGIFIFGPGFRIVNNIIAQNGSAESFYGGVGIDNRGARSPQVFEFNTIAANRSETDTSASGVNCKTESPMTASSNIVWDGLGAAPILAGDCGWAYSIVEGGVDGTGNSDQDPLFVAPADGDFHVQAGSPAIDVADPGTTVGDDFDGDDRPAGDGPDIGADEVP